MQSGSCYLIYIYIFTWKAEIHCYSKKWCASIVAVEYLLHDLLTYSLVLTHLHNAQPPKDWMLLLVIGGMLVMDIIFLVVVTAVPTAVLRAEKHETVSDLYIMWWKCVCVYIHIQYVIRMCVYIQNTQMYCVYVQYTTHVSRSHLHCPNPSLSFYYCRSPLRSRSSANRTTCLQFSSPYLHSSPSTCGWGFSLPLRIGGSTSQPWTTPSTLLPLCTAPLWPASLWCPLEPWTWCTRTYDTESLLEDFCLPTQSS